MPDDPAVELVRRLLRLADQYQVAELEVEEAGLKVTVRGPFAAAGVEPAESPEASPTAWTAREPAPEDAESDHLHLLISPMTGTFYRSETPDAPPLVEPGMRVDEGQT